VKHADATQLATKINEILGVSAGGVGGGGGGGGGRGNVKGGGPAADTGSDNGAGVPSKILVDDRTNTLIVAGSEPAFQRVKALVERLDISLDVEGSLSMHVYQLGSAVANELAKTLKVDAIITGNGG